MNQKETFKILMDNGISFAKEMLEKYGEFYPYGRSMNDNKDISVINAYNGEEYPSGIELLKLLEADLTQKSTNENVIAIATFTNVTMQGNNKESINAVQVGLEHKEGYSVNVYYPYVIEDQKVIFDELNAVERTPNIFS